MQSPYKQSTRHAIHSPTTSAHHTQTQTQTQSQHQTQRAGQTPPQTMPVHPTQRSSQTQRPGQTHPRTSPIPQTHPVPPKMHQQQMQTRNQSQAQRQPTLEERLRLALATTGPASDAEVEQLLALGANPNALDPTWSWRIAFFNYTDAKGYTPLDFYWFALRDHLPRLCPDVEDQPNQLYTWGDASNYALGHGHTNYIKFPRIVRDLQHYDISFVAMSQLQTMAITSKGEAFLWGFERGGCSEKQEACPLPAPVPCFSTRPTWKAFLSPSHHAYLTKDSKLWTRGQGESGQLGHGDRTSLLIPKLVAALKKSENIHTVAVSAGHTCAVANNGVLYTFGNKGQLGHGSLEDELMPRKVTLTNSMIVGVHCQEYMTVAWNDKQDVYWWGLGHSRPKRIKYSWGYPSLHRPRDFMVRKALCSNSGSILILVQAGPREEMQKAELYAFIPEPNTELASRNEMKAEETVPVPIIPSGIDMRRIDDIGIDENSLFCMTNGKQLYSLSLNDIELESRIRAKKATSGRPFVPNHRPLSSSPTKSPPKYTPSPATRQPSSEAGVTVTAERHHLKGLRPVRILIGPNHKAALVPKLICPPRITISTTTLVQDLNDVLPKNRNNVDVCDDLLVQLINSNIDCINSISSDSLAANPKKPNLAIGTADVALVFGEESNFELLAHSSILSRRSPYFATILETNLGSTWKESRSKTFLIPEVNSKICALMFLSFIYSDGIPVDDNNFALGTIAQFPTELNMFLELLSLSHRLMMTRLEELCTDNLLQAISPNTAMQLWSIAELLDSTLFKNYVLDFLLFNLERCIYAIDLDEEGEKVHSGLIVLGSKDLRTHLQNRFIELFGPENTFGYLKQAKMSLLSETPAKNRILTGSRKKRQEVAAPEPVELEQKEPAEETKEAEGTEELKQTQIPEEKMLESPLPKSKAKKNRKVDMNESNLTPAQRKELHDQQAEPKKQIQSTPPQIPPTKPETPTKQSFTWGSVPKASVSLKDIQQEEMKQATPKRQPRATQPVAIPKPKPTPNPVSNYNYKAKSVSDQTLPKSLREIQQEEEQKASPLKSWGKPSPPLYSRKKPAGTYGQPQASLADIMSEQLVNQLMDEEIERAFG